MLSYTVAIIYMYICYHIPCTILSTVPGRIPGFGYHVQYVVVMECTTIYILYTI